MRSVESWFPERVKLLLSRKGNLNSFLKSLLLSGLKSLSFYLEKKVGKEVRRIVF